MVRSALVTYPRAKAGDGCAFKVRQITSKLSLRVRSSGELGPAVPQTPRPNLGGVMTIDRAKAPPVLGAVMAWIAALVLAGVPRIR